MKTRRLNKDKLKNICICDSGEEEFQNGIFKFNISAMLDDIDANRIRCILAIVPIKELEVLSISPDYLMPEHIDAADTDRPVILLEMAPDYKNYLPDIPVENYISRGYVLADGNHRVAKAAKLGLDSLPAYIIRMEDHIRYMYEHSDEYADYWNMKLKEREKGIKH